jgi:hypothetical protein
MSIKRKIETVYDNETQVDVFITPRRSKRIKEIGNVREGKISSDWVSASSTRSYLLNDPILDWLKYHGNEQRTRSEKTGAKRSVNLNPLPDSFHQFILNKGIAFESAVMKFIQNKIGGENIVTIASSPSDSYLIAKQQETFAAMCDGVPVIAQGVLHNYSDNTFGIPDLIVRSDWIQRIINKPYLDDDIEISARKLPKINGKIPKYHYRIIDIKFHTLQLKSNGMTIKNVGSVPCYKAQVMIYNRALEALQGYLPPKCYILGRGWNCKKQNDYTSCDNCIDRLGHIDIFGEDAIYNKRIQEAVNWVRDVRNEGHTWDIYPVPSRKELYPNMCNRSDEPFHHQKKQIALLLEDITLLWQCGPKNRKLAFESGITRWSDPDLNAETLGITGPKQSKILQAMLDFNHGKFGDSLVYPEYLPDESDSFLWEGPERVELFIDFESVNNTKDDFGKIPYIGGSSYVFMIGMGIAVIKSSKTKTTIGYSYKNFHAKTLSQQGEFAMARDFITAVETIKTQHKVKSPLCIHWGRAEATYIRDLARRHPTLSYELGRLDLFDIQELIRSTPILVKGVFGFGLKEFASTMSANEMIDIEWESDVKGGSDAMIAAWKCYQYAENKSINISKDDKFLAIIDYNRIDCEAMYAILTYLRNNHC